jgi:recombination protein RecA
MNKLGTGELKSAIIGMVIGDGCLSSCGKNAYFQCSHCAAQYDYLLWKKKIVDQIAKCKIYRNDKTDKKTGKVYKTYHMNSLTNPKFTGLYNRFYQVNGKKSLDEYLVKMITPLALAIVYMDDGATQQINPNFKAKINTFFLRLCNFDYANLFLLKKSLKIKYDLDWNIIKHSPGRKYKRTYYQLRLLNKHNDRFIEVVKPYIEYVPCMAYKLGSYANTPNNGGDIVCST